MDWFQGFEGLKLSVRPNKFLGGGEGGGWYEQECSPSLEVPGMAAGRTSEYPCTEREVIRQEVVHVSDTNNIKAAPVRPENMVASRPEDSYLSDLGPSLQVPKPTVLVEVENQVYKIVLHDEIHHLLALRAP